MEPHRTYKGQLITKHDNLHLETHFEIYISRKLTELGDTDGWRNANIHVCFLLNGVQKICKGSFFWVPGIKKDRFPDP